MVAGALGGSGKFNPSGPVGLQPSTTRRVPSVSGHLADADPDTAVGKDECMTLRFPVPAAAARVTLMTAASLLLLAAADVPSALAPIPVTAPATFEATVLAIDTTTVAAADIAATDDQVLAPLDAPVRADTRRLRLASMIDTVQVDLDADAELRCLATAVYFEARGEPLEGQLAVAQAIRNRVASGRYASSICGVVRQPGQFTYSHARLPRGGNDWRIAQAIAAIAQGESWHEVAPRTTSFHASFVKPGWSGMTRVTRIGNHVFYR